MSAVADVLSRAADLIERHGWRGPGDLSGFIDHLAPVTYQWAVDILQDHLGERMRVWEAAPERTQTEVVAALRAASERAA